MSATMTVDTREFQRVAEKLLATSSRTFPKFINGQLFRVATLAIKATEKADRHRVERQMGTVRKVEKVRSSSAAKGWVRISRRELIHDSFAARIINARLRARGADMVWGQELIERARKLIAAKARSVAFIKSGWIPAVQRLAPLVGMRGASLDGAKKIGAPKGYAIPATFTLSGEVRGEIGNTALMHRSKFSAWHGKAGNPMPIAQKGLQTAINLTVRDMANEFYRRTAIDLKPFGATYGP
jgi:hypothetical protein